MDRKQIATVLRDYARHVAGLDAGPALPAEAFADRILTAHRKAVTEAVKAERDLADAAWEVFKKQEPLLAQKSVKHLEWAFPVEYRDKHDKYGRVAWTLRYRNARALLETAKAGA